VLQSGSSHKNRYDLSFPYVSIIDETKARWALL
jgi:hypothetical protein